MDKEIHKKANRLDYAIRQLSNIMIIKADIPRVLTTTYVDSGAELYNDVAKQLNQKVADYQYSLMVEALNELQKQYDEL